MRVNRAQRMRIVNVPAPVGGWNARDSLAQMPTSDAVIMKNWWPNTASVDIRPGSKTWATGFSTNVNTLMPYNPSTGTGKLFAACESGIYDVTLGGAIGSPVVSGLTNDQWSYTNFAVPGGAYLLAVNGQDGYYTYNGMAWQSVTSSSSPLSITGVDPTTLSHVSAYASRVWFIQKNSLKAFYLPVNQVGGAASEFDMTQLFRRGGHLVAMGVWTVDGGYGMQDYAAWVTSEGEIAVYGGTDPNQASTWTLAGVYQVGNPMGPRCFMKYGGDLLYLGKDGLGPMSKLMASSRVNSQINLTGKIQGAIAQATTSYASNFGWSIVLHPVGNALIMNVPVAAGHQEQYVMNTITGAWGRFTGWHASCWERFQDRIYFGANGSVVNAWASNYDDDGQAISAEALQSFSYFGTQQLKQFVQARPIMETNGTPQISMGLNLDFDVLPIEFTPSFSGLPNGVWDQSMWDQNDWSSGIETRKDWMWLSGVGYAGAIHFSTQVLDSYLSWAATDYGMIDGGIM